MNQNILWLHELRLADLARVGGKNSSLGEMIGHLANLGVSVPGGFATTSEAFKAVIAHNESPISSWLPREYDLNLTYADEHVAFSPYLTALRAAIRRETEAKIEKGE